ncbi:hypothetical protein A8924_3925 [Saccharopolyspora erythraea NRRL 2338]|uniref:Uncharacterized protein n=1 Tax=Saccharopolyspora erythraea (strain ATCC 11635 / DSM 40517 / JCM 4748 / NBRC 13426 / NCIMB 8594 / NRRL 2338) TaxID=405948 RepID=A4FFI1_SACEN|nr:hypothetical protein N599_36595 [Saccharopolyspora erythraea D]PFG96527.1 hypothetical protein A8924_3925 [Saccharopolyspora erythraea NRRL 2338]CAM02806.1 hypothetical protein SACE_3532 [Saccharopolyspora erythraea NRRL 2338]
MTGQPGFGVGLVFRAEFSDDGDVGQAGLFGDLADHRVGQSLTGFDATSGYLGTGSGDADLVEDEELMAGSGASDDLGGDAEACRARMRQRIDPFVVAVPVPSHPR